jgi:hypothetical protein
MTKPNVTQPHQLVTRTEWEGGYVEIEVGYDNCHVYAASKRPGYVWRLDSSAHFPPNLKPYGLKQIAEALAVVAKEVAA